MIAIVLVIVGLVVLALSLAAASARGERMFEPSAWYVEEVE